MDMFSSPTREWFSHAFTEGPTEAQRKAWPIIAEGKNTLVIAPTGSGKTLAAFLYAIDRLMRVQGSGATYVADSRQGDGAPRRNTLQYFDVDTGTARHDVDVATVQPSTSRQSACGSGREQADKDAGIDGGNGNIGNANGASNAKGVSNTSGISSTSDIEETRGVGDADSCEATDKRRSGNDSRDAVGTDNSSVTDSNPDRQRSDVSSALPKNAKDAKNTKSGKNSKSGRSGGNNAKNPKGVKVLYISPLKALGVDVAHNLTAPLEGITAQCVAQGLDVPHIRVATRSGDTTPKERRAITSHPPDILVTTPESLYLMLTSKARRILCSVDTVIVDEIHAVAGTKRGAHLAVSLERLDLLTTSPAQRIGLSATVKPPEEAARFLGGVQEVTVVDASTAPAMDLRIVDPARTMPSSHKSQASYKNQTSPYGKGSITRDFANQPISGVTPAMRRLAEQQEHHSRHDYQDHPDHQNRQSYQSYQNHQSNHSQQNAFVSQQTDDRQNTSGFQKAGDYHNINASQQSEGLKIAGVLQQSGIRQTPDYAHDSPNNTLATDITDATEIIDVGGHDDRSNSMWPQVERHILNEILSHHTTLVFVNSRGLAERLTARLNDLYTSMPIAGDSAQKSQENGESNTQSDVVAMSVSDAVTPARNAAMHTRDGYGGKRHYDAVVGSSTNLIPPRDPDREIAMAHHGSVSKDRRKRIEEDLKHGRLRCVVATSSLELGIDMGSVDLVIQVSPPLSVSSGLQRVGRADHRVGGVSHALFYPLTREQIIGTAATVEGMKAGDIEPLTIPRCPLDILAQQTVAAASMEDLKPDEWYATVCRSAPFTDLDRTVFDSVLGMLSGDYNSEEFSAFRPLLVWNRDDDIISARPGSQRLAVTSGGTIPDRGLYTVVLPESDAGPGSRRVGELDEEMVYESRVGDVITLGTSTWQIQEITRDRVIVTPAPGRTARLPFWHGDGNGRDAGFGALQGRFVREVTAGLIDGDDCVNNNNCTNNNDCVDNKSCVADNIADNDCANDDNCLDGNGCADDSDCAEGYVWGLADSSPSNSSSSIAADSNMRDDSAISGNPHTVNDEPHRNKSHGDEPHRDKLHRDELRRDKPHRDEPSRARFMDDTLARLRDDGLDDNAIDNLADVLHEQRRATGIVPNDRNLLVERCPDEEGDWRIVLHSPYGRRVHEPWAMIVSNRIKQRYGYDGQVYAADDGIVVRLPQGDAHIPAADLFLFEPDDVYRQVAEQVGESVLFAARFRECAARSLYLPRANPGKRVPLWQQRLRAAQLLNAARTQRNFPLILETTRECLQDVYDLTALRKIMTSLQNGTITLTDVETQDPSPFAENLLFGYVGQVMYQYDQPQAERNASLLSLDFDALERLLGTTDMSTVLDADVVREVEQELGERTFWNELDEHDVSGRVARYAKTHGPFTADKMIADLGIDAESAVHELDRLKTKGEVLSGTFIAAPEHADTTQYLHRSVFQRIRSRSLNKARAAVKPVESHVYQSLLLDRQGVGPVGGERYEGVDGLSRVIEQLEGVSLPLQVWEDSVFPARIRDYQPAMLDELLASGEVVWVGSKTAGTKAKEPGRIAFHPSDSQLLGRDLHSGAKETEESEELEESESADTLPDAIMHVLAAGGAFRVERLTELTRAAWKSDVEVVDPETGEIREQPWSNNQFEDALWSLVWQGMVTNSSLAPVRAMSTSNSHTKRNVSVGRIRRRVRVTAQVPVVMQGLWLAVPNATATNEQRLLAQVETLLDRYGIIAAPLIDAEDVPGGFSALYPVLRRMEEHGTLLRGMFVKGFGAAQFARRDTVEQLRHVGEGNNQSCVAIEVNDPANLTGGVVQWPQFGDKATKPSRRAGGMVVLDRGHPVVYAAVKGHHLTTFTDDADTLRRAFTELAYTLQRRPSGSVTFADVDGEPLSARTEAAHILHTAGFTPCPQGMKLYR